MEVEDLATASETLVSPVQSLDASYDRQRLEDVGFLTSMTLVLLGNYAQTGHFGGPLAYTPYNVATHLAGPSLGGLRFDYRRPKHPYSDKFMLAGGHCVPTCYALWMVMGQALERRYSSTGDKRYYVDPSVAILPIDALGFRRGAGALKALLQDHGLSEMPLFAQAKARGIKALAGHAESVDVTNDVNGGPSGIGIATAAGKAAFWDVAGASIDGPKIIAFEGEFAMTEGHAQELKTQALALKTGKRLRVMISDNNAGIDDSDPADRRPVVLIGKTTKGYWPAAVGGTIPDHGTQVVGYPSHPYAMKMNSEYFVALARTFEKRYGVTFQGIADGPVTDNRDRLIQYKTNIDVAMSVLEKNGLGDWLADHLVEIGDSVRDDLPLRISASADSFLDDRLRVKNLPIDPQKVTVSNPASGATKDIGITLFRKAGEVAGTRRAISEIVKWLK